MRLRHRRSAIEDLSENSRLYCAGQADSGETLCQAPPCKMSVALRAIPIGRERPDIRPGLRSLPIQNYIVFHQLVDDTVEIVSVVHGSRDVNTLFDGEP